MKWTVMVPFGGPVDEKLTMKIVSERTIDKRV
jgi:hypothetical protein